MNLLPVPVEETNNANWYCLKSSIDIPEKDIVYTAGSLNNYFSNYFDAIVDYLHKRYESNPNIQIFFNHQSEGLDQNFIKYLHLFIVALQKKCSIKVEQFNYVSGAVNSTRTIEAYKNICEKNNYIKASLWIDNYWEIYSNKNLPKFNLEFTKKEKRVLCYNRQPRLHRMASLCEILKRNIFNQCYISMKIEKYNAIRYDFLGINRLLQHDVADEYKELIKKNAHIFPLNLTLKPDATNAYNINDQDRRLFKNTVVSLVNETIFSNRDPIEHKLADTLSYPCTFLTEKLNKTFQGLHPFILMSTPHFLSDLRTLGYKTFHPYIDETYDMIEDDGLRFQKVMDEVERFAKMRDSQVFEFQHNTKDILLHNYNLLKTKSRSIVRVL